MDFETFEHGIRTLIGIDEREDKINALGAELFEDFVFADSREPFEFIFKMLWSWSDVSDAKDMLNYYIFDLSYGRKWTSDCIIESTSETVKEENRGKSIKLSTISDMYYYLCGNTVYCNNKDEGVPNEKTCTH